MRAPNRLVGWIYLAGDRCQSEPSFNLQPGEAVVFGWHLSGVAVPCSNDVRNQDKTSERLSASCYSPADVEVQHWCYLSKRNRFGTAEDCDPVCSDTLTPGGRTMEDTLCQLQEQLCQHFRELCKASFPVILCIRASNRLLQPGCSH